MGDEWSSDANEAVSVEIIQAGEHGPRTIQRFHPKFTYPIFGDEQRIFGYKDLNITLRLTAHDLRPNIIISYEKRYPSVGETHALDIGDVLKGFVPESTFDKATDFDQSIQDDSSAVKFKPPGQLVKSYERKNQHYEIWVGPLSDERIKATIERIQILVSLFIEGGTPLDTEDSDLDRWRVYFIYSKSVETSEPNQSPYSFVGYATAYRWCALHPQYYKDSSQQDIGETKKDIGALLDSATSMDELPTRFQISQFLVLPPFQGTGHGSALYSTIYEQAHTDKMVWELTVEDPSEEFDVLRDLNDWKILEPKFDAAGVLINTSPLQDTKKRTSTRLPTSQILPVELLRSIRSSTKIAPRQFNRLLEMYLLSKIPHSRRAAGGANLQKLLIQKWRLQDPNDRFYYWWRLLVKQRIFKKNREILSQLEGDEKHLKIEETARGQEDEYEKLLFILAHRASDVPVRNESGGGNISGDGESGDQQPVVMGRKRKLVVDEDDDEDDDDDDGSEAGEPDPKLMRTS